MKSKNFLSNLWSSVAGSQRNDVEFDRRLTVGSPSGFTINWTLKLVSVLVLVLSLGIGNVWGETVTTTFTSSSWGDANSGWTSNTNGSDFVERGVANNGVNGACTSKTSYSSGIYSISIVASSNAGTNKIKVLIGSTVIADKTIANADNITYTYDYNDYPSIATLSGNVKIQVTANSKTTWVKSITISYATSAYTVSFSAGTGTCAASPMTESGAGYGVTLPSASPSAACSTEGWSFIGWKRTSAQAETTDVPDMYPAGSTYHPESNETLYAVYKLGTYYTIDFENESSSYTDWTFTNITSQGSGSIVAHGGNNYGTTGGATTAYITTTNAINPKYIRFYVSKSSDNTTASNWKVQTSSNGSDWADRKTQEAASMSKGTWVEVTQDLSSYTGVYVRIYYSGSNAVRTIDDLALSCAVFNSNPSCCGTTVSLGTGALSNGTVTFGLTNVPTCSSTTSDRQTTMTISPSSGYKLSAFSWETGDGYVSPTEVSPSINTAANENTPQEITLTFAKDADDNCQANVSFSEMVITGWTWTKGGGSIPATIDVYVGQKIQLDVTMTPADVLDSHKNNTSYTYNVDGTYIGYPTCAAKYFTFKGKSATESTTITLTHNDDTSTPKVFQQVVYVRVKALPSVTFTDIVHDETFSAVTATVDAGELTVTTTKKTPTHADVAEPGTGNSCEKQHLHLVGWIDKDWVDDGHQDATHEQIIAATEYFYAPNADIDLVAKNGKTYLAVWAKEVMP